MKSEKQWGLTPFREQRFALRAWLKPSSYEFEGPTMRQFNIREAKAHLSNLVGIASAGEEVIIAKAGSLVPVRGPSVLRKKSLLDGRIKIGPEFDQPVCASAIASFEGRGQP